MTAAGGTWAAGAWATDAAGAAGPATTSCSLVGGTSDFAVFSGGCDTLSSGPAETAWSDSFRSSGAFRFCGRGVPREGGAAFFVASATAPPTTAPAAPRFADSPPPDPSNPSRSCFSGAGAGEVASPEDWTAAGTLTRIASTSFSRLYLIQ